VTEFRRPGFWGNPDIKPFLKGKSTMVSRSSSEESSASPLEKEVVDTLARQHCAFDTSGEFVRLSLLEFISGREEIILLPVLSHIGEDNLERYWAELRRRLDKLPDDYLLVFLADLNAGGGLPQFDIILRMARRYGDDQLKLLASEFLLDGSNKSDPERPQPKWPNAEALRADLDKFGMAEIVSQIVEEAESV